MILGYGIIAVLALFFGFVIWSRFRGRGHGMGCCGGHENAPEKVIEGEKVDPEQHSGGCHCM
jgi:hypothetical protein